jgi:hypothetical protein
VRAGIVLLQVDSDQIDLALQIGSESRESRQVIQPATAGQRSRCRVNSLDPLKKGPVKGRILVGMIAEVQQEPELAEIWGDRFMGPVREQDRTIVEQAIERGEVSPDAGPDVVFDFDLRSRNRLLRSHLPLTGRSAQAVVDMVVAGVRTSDPTS